MAASFSPLLKLELPEKPIQELIKTTGKQVPERYIYKLPNKAADHSVIKYMDSPIIDFQLLSASSLQGHEKELRKLRSTLSSWGCFQVCYYTFKSSQSHSQAQAQSPHYFLGYLLS